MGQVIYQVSEKVVIIRTVGLDYLVEDVDTGKQYLVDRAYFKRKYEAVGEKQTD
jgi:hypothetical protein